MRRWVALAPLAALLLLGVLFVGFGLRRDPRVEPAALVGRPLPAVALAPLGGGGATRVGAAVAGPKLVNFFASWCVPCAEEHPALMALKAQGVPIVGVAYKDDAAATRRFLNLRGDPFAVVLMDPKGSAGVEFGASGVPETYAVDARGVIAAKHSGALSPADAAALLERADIR